MDLIKIGQQAKEASLVLATSPTQQKNQALLLIADELEQNIPNILVANKIDIQGAKANGTSEALLDRLLLTEKRLIGIANDVRKVVSLKDPVGSELDSYVLENGLSLCKKSTKR